MEYVDGGSLQDLLASHGHLSSQRTVEISLDLADALTRAGEYPRRTWRR